MFMQSRIRLRRSRPAADRCRRALSSLSGTTHRHRRFVLDDERLKLNKRFGSDYAENQAARQIPMKMADWVARLDAFLKFNEYEVLANAGRVSSEVARRLAEEQYDKFRVRQDREFESDFDAEVKRIQSTRRREKKGDL